MNATHKTEVADELEQFNAGKHKPHQGGMFGFVSITEDPKLADENGRKVKAEMNVTDAEDLPMEFLEIVNEHDGDVEVVGETEWEHPQTSDKMDMIEVEFEV
jgi:hypothetical protein